MMTSSEVNFYIVCNLNIRNKYQIFQDIQQPTEVNRDKAEKTGV